MVKPYTYRATLTDPGLSDRPLHEWSPRGCAYEHDTHFIHAYGDYTGLLHFTDGLATVSEAKAGDLQHWISDHFGAEDIVEMDQDVGTVVEGVWRPGLYYLQETREALGGSDADLRSDESTLRILVERLDELLLYIEPSPSGLGSHSHRTRELLILACTEVENQWKRYLDLANYVGRGRNLTTADYVKLAPKLYLGEFAINLRPYEALEPLRPFQNWDAAAPTQSIPCV